MDFDLKSSLTFADFEGKTVFWDIDGTLAPYRFNGHVHSKDRPDHGMSDLEMKNHVFLSRLPSKHMQRIMWEVPAKQHVICGQYTSEVEYEDKQVWLD